MKINVSQLLKSGIGTTRNYKMSESVNVTDNGIDSIVEGDIKLIRTDKGILARATLHTETEVICSRCLSSFIYPLNIEFEEEYFPTVDIVEGNSLALPGEPGCFTIDEHHILDLIEAIRQYALLGIPMKPLCGANCAGLCPDCGQNLNRGTCNCPPPGGDPRWDKLRELSLTSDNKDKKRKGAQ